MQDLANSWLRSPAAPAGSSATIALAPGDRGEVAVPAPHPLQRPGTAHLVGIGGAGLRSLAHVLASAGWNVSGSDQTAASFPKLAGARFPIRFQAGHEHRHVPRDADLLVYSSAIGVHNVERMAARDHAIDEIEYPQMLGRLQQGRLGIGVAGTHGKSTTTAMLASIFIAAGTDPTVVVGAIPNGAASGGRFGRGAPVLVEACEYRRNFLQLECRAAVVLNVEWDHCETYPDRGAVAEAFGQFAAQLPADGLLVANFDCPVARYVGHASRPGAVTFGLEPGAQWRATRLEAARGCYRFRVQREARGLTDIVLRTPGRHNVCNALGAAVLAAELGISARDIRLGLESYAGLERRCQTWGTFGGVTLVDDYAHHPTAVRATLATLREQYPGRRLWCVFQPHQAGRTAALLDEFAQSLHNADAVLVAEIYRARESDAAQASSADLVRRVPPGPRICELASDREALLARLVRECVAGDVVVTCGAGDIGKVLHGLRERL